MMPPRRWMRPAWISGLWGLSGLVLTNACRATEATEKIAAASRGLGAGGYLGQLIGGLAFVTLVIVALAWVMRRFSGTSAGGQARAIEILAVRSVGTRERLMLVQVGEEQLLIGVSPAGMRTLHHLKNPIAPQPDNKAGVDFASLLRKQMSKADHA